MAKAVGIFFVYPGADLIDLSRSDANEMCLAGIIEYFAPVGEK
jgi:hypothetical protein